MLTRLRASRMHYAISCGNQFRQCDLYGSNSSKLVMSPISGGIRTRWLPYRLNTLTDFSVPIDFGSVTICSHFSEPIPSCRPSAASTLREQSIRLRSL